MYTLKLNAGLYKQFEKIPRKDIERIWEKIKLLQDDPLPRWTEKLKGRLGYRIAIGNYRVIYTVDDNEKIVMIVAVDDRKDVYRKY